MLDTIVVGSGLAGAAFALKMQEEGAEVIVFDNGSQQASNVAAGLYNPVVLKRFNMTWQGQMLMQTSLPSYKKYESILGLPLLEELRIFRRLASVEEQNSWVTASDQPGLSEFLNPKCLTNTNPQIDAPFGFGELLGCGRLHTTAFLTAFRKLMKDQACLREERFDHKQLQINGDTLSYKDIKARHIVFCEGFGMRQNPYFSYLPLQGTKGEYLIIEAPDLKEAAAIKAGMFLLPLGDDRYQFGATYNWKDQDPQPSKAAREELLFKLEKLIYCDYRIVEQTAGIRPTVPDRRPLVGRHPGYENLYTLNGFGSRGVLLAPYASQALFDLIHKGINLPQEMDINRFRKHYAKTQKS